MRALFAFAAFVTLSSAVVAQELRDHYPPGKGRDEAFYACAGCHAFKIVAEKKFGRAEWAGVIDRMNRDFGAPKLEADERALILDYLTGAFGPR